MKSSMSTAAKIGVLILIPVCLAIVVVVAMFAVRALTGPTKLEDVAAECSDLTGDSITTGDGGDSLSVESGGRLTADEATEMSVCVLAKLDAPDSLIDKIETTTSNMGRETDSWDDLEVSWTYHPDNGLEVIIELT